MTTEPIENDEHFQQAREQTLDSIRRGRLRSQDVEIVAAAVRGDCDVITIRKRRGITNADLFRISADVGWIQLTSPTTADISVPLVAYGAPSAGKSDLPLGAFVLGVSVLVAAWTAVLVGFVYDASAVVALTGV